MFYCLQTSDVAIKSKTFLIPDHMDETFISLSEAERIFSLSQIFQNSMMTHFIIRCILIHCAKFFYWPFNMEIPHFLSRIVHFLGLFNDDFSVLPFQNLCYQDA